MKAILQRVLSASVTVEKELISSIGKGILVFAAVAPGDTEKDAEALASKVLKMRMWDDEVGGRWKHSVQDISGEILCVSQFTLLASTKKGNKPDFHGAMGGEQAKELYQFFVSKVQQGYQAERVKDGVFQAMTSSAGKRWACHLGSFYRIKCNKIMKSDELGAQLPSDPHDSTQTVD